MSIKSEEPSNTHSFIISCYEKEKNYFVWLLAVVKRLFLQDQLARENCAHKIKRTKEKERTSLFLLHSTSHKYENNLPSISIMNSNTEFRLLPWSLIKKNQHHDRHPHYFQHFLSYTHEEII